MLKISKKLLAISSILLLTGCGEKPTAKLRIVSGPNKTSYNCGNDFDSTGLTVEYVDAAGNATTIDKFDIVGGKNLTFNSQVKVSYQGLTTNINLDISNVIQGQFTCVGDSLTEGHNWPTESYPNFIKDNFDDSSKIVVSNCGKNGASFKTFGQYNPAYDTTTQYQTSLTGDPIVLTILLGTNDATNWAEEHDLYVQDYKALVGKYRETFGDDLNIIMLTSPRCLTNTFGIPSDTICNEVVPLQKQLAEELNCYLIDLNGEFEKYTDEELFRPNDGVHFTKYAAEITAKLISDKITEIYEIN